MPPWYWEVTPWSLSILRCANLNVELGNLCWEERLRLLGWSEWDVPHVYGHTTLSRLILTQLGEHWDGRRPPVSSIWMTFPQLGWLCWSVTCHWGWALRFQSLWAVPDALWDVSSWLPDPAWAPLLSHHEWALTPRDCKPKQTLPSTNCLSHGVSSQWQRVDQYLVTELRPGPAGSQCK